MLKKKQLLKKVLGLLLVLSILIKPTESVLADSNSNISTYQGNGFAVTFVIDSQWSGAATGRILVKNTSDTVIENWALAFDFGCEIVNIYNAVIETNNNNHYLIKNAGWNQDIMPGQSINFGFIVNIEGELLTPSSYTIPSINKMVNKVEYTVDFHITSDWGTGFNGEFIINNLSERRIEDWSLEFDFSGTIDSFWTAKLDSHDGNHYVIRNAGYNANIEAGTALKIGFGGKTDNDKNMPVNFILKQDGIAKDGSQDSDNDGLKDYLEEMMGTNPYITDSDGDRIPDGYEFKILNTDPIKHDTDDNGIDDDSEDFDADNYSNYDEYLAGTNPYAADTDNDGLSDMDELKYKTDPLLYDTDSDLLSDGEEVALGFDPLSPYTNADILDSDYVFDQEVNETQLADINQENPYQLSVELKAAGHAGTALKAEESIYTAALSENDSIVGKVVSLSYQNHQLKDAKIKFKIEDSVMNHTNLNYPNEPGLEGVQRFQIFRFNEIYGILYPVETEYDIVNKTLSLHTSELGTYCIIDLDQWLYELGIDFGDDNSIVSMSNLYAENIVNHEIPEIKKQETTSNQEKVQADNSDQIVENETLPDNYHDIVLQQIRDVCDEDPVQMKASFDTSTAFAAHPMQLAASTRYNKQIDLVFVVDTSGSMGDKINKCKSYMKTLIQNLYSDGITARVAVVSFDDYSNANINYKLSTGGLWGKNPNEASELISQVKITDGVYENHVDALETALELSYRTNTTKFAVLLSDEPIITKNNNSKIGASGVASKLKSTDIITSVVCMNNDNSTYKSIYEETDGIQISITSNFNLYLELFIKTVMEDNKTFLAIIPTTLTTITLDKVPNQADKITDTDGDLLVDRDEIDWKRISSDANNLILPTIAEYFDSLGFNDRARFSRLSKEKADIINSMVVLPLLSNPNKKDSDNDGYNDNIDAYPLKYITEISYIFYEWGGDGFLKDEAESRVKAIKKGGGNVRVYGVNTVAEFTTNWGQMGLNHKGKVEYEISDVYTVFHGEPDYIYIGKKEYITTSIISSLANKKIDTLHLSSCNNGNLDWINKVTKNGEDFEQNIAITFLKKHSNISKIKAWDGYATCIDIAGHKIEYSSSFTDLWEAIFDNSDFEKWSYAKNGYKRIPTGLITYSRDRSNHVVFSPNIRYHFISIPLVAGKLLVSDEITEVIH
jgi:hypothetical protein